MKKYLVGGFVRDRILGKYPKDKDYVLVGAKPRDIEYLKSIGYTQVGKDFPVFLSPEGHEHALARIERKVGVGYSGFEVETEGVTLEEDLLRRDLTINAIAYDPVLKTHIDPYNGKSDLRNKILRHVSDEHFGEDPLRVLRLARFVARYSDFTVHASTDVLVRKMVQDGDLNHLTKERVYTEFEKAFSDENPYLFLKYMRDIGALEVVLPTFKATKEEFRLIESICDNSTDMYRSEYLWAVLLRDADVKNHSTGLLKLPVKYTKFSAFVLKHADGIMKFRRSTVEEMVNTLSEMGIKNNGGEDFLYKVLEYFVIRREIDLELEDLVIKVYDRFTDAPLADLEEKVNNGEVKPADMFQYVRNTRIEHVKKMF